MDRSLISLFALGLGLALSSTAGADEADKLRIIGKETTYTVESQEGPVEITRVLTPCAKNKGWLQPMVPTEGITPVGEIEVLEALNDADTLVVDMREIEWHLKGTIPGAIHVPYTEIAKRLDEFGCVETDGKMDCSNAKSVIGFCNGPVCPQSPMGMKAMVREGFPAEKILYYRGGMFAWDGLGLTMIEGML